VPDNFAGPNAIPVTNVAGPSAIPATFFYPWGGLGGFHQNVASPSAIPAGTFFPWGGLGTYHGDSVTSSVYFDQHVAATGGGSYAFNNGKSSNYYNYNHLLMDGGSNFSLDANYYTEAFLPLGDMTSPEMPHQPNQTKIANSETDEKYNTFKQFDTVGDHSDHFYALPGNGKVSTVKKVPHSIFWAWSIFTFLNLTLQSL
jgi:ubiquitin-conjugating enzyme E2 O